MDALAAILMPGFKESNWTDQEVGVAFGRGVLIIPIIRGLNPYGFIGKYQGLQAAGKQVPQVADQVFQTLIASPLTRARMLTCLVDTTLQSAHESDAIEKLQHLDRVRDLPPAYIERLREAAGTSAVFANGPAREQLTQLLLKNGFQKIPSEEPEKHASDQDMPF
jgi:hypothetical protein